MKNLIIAVFCLVSVYGVAQVNFGAKAGVNVSKISDIHGESKARTGMFAGGFAEISIEEYGSQFYIQPELLYSMLGEKNGEEKINLDYLIAPILFKAYFSENDSEFFGEIGPQFGFLINEKVPETDKYKKFDYGITAGIGFSYSRNWEASARFYYGLSDTEEKTRVDGKDMKNINSNVNFGISYIF